MQQGKLSKLKDCHKAITARKVNPNQHKTLLLSSKDDQDEFRLAYLYYY